MIDISVVVPTWNVSNYICDCLDSILAQKHVNVEIIIVNRAGTDGTEKLVEEYTCEHKNITAEFLPSDTDLVTQRNTGILMAKGEYIAFCDADDILPEDKNVYFSMLNKARREKADLLVGNFYRERNGERYRDVFKGTGFERCMQRINLAFWNKLFRRQFIMDNHIMLPKGINTFEDAVFCVEFLLKEPKISCLDRFVYVYRENRLDDEGEYQTNHNVHLEKVVWDMKALEWVSLKKYKDNIPSWTNLYFQMMNMCYWFSWMRMKNTDEKREAFLTFQETLKNINQHSKIGKIDTEEKEQRFAEIVGMDILSFLSISYDQYMFYRLLTRTPCAQPPVTQQQASPESVVQMAYSGQIGMKTIIKCIMGWIKYKLHRKHH